MGPQDLVPPLGLFLGLIHQGVLVACRVELGQELRVDELLHLVARKGNCGLINELPQPMLTSLFTFIYIVDHEMHDGLGH